jgi:hypothetical protein
MMNALSIEHLNADCTCVTLDRDALCKSAEEVVGNAQFCRDLAVTHPHLLSAQPLFLSPAHAARMQAIITAIETVAKLPAYQAAVLDYAPDIARFAPGPVGLFMGYDFHLGLNGPQLIEINTNAGGALINAYLLQAQKACCTDMASSGLAQFNLDALLQTFLSNVTREWQRQGRMHPLRTIAIVDDKPQAQYLYPEFVLFQRLFEAHGFHAIIAAPEALVHRDGALWHGATAIDFVYNRLTDFALASPQSQDLRSAYLGGVCVVSPHPRAHALFANKRNLTVLTDAKMLRAGGVDAAVIATLLAGIPQTEVVRAVAADDLWARRNDLFFKPNAGFGSKAAYRGDKITRKVWAEILAGDYVAQSIVPPSARSVARDGQVLSMKVDLRNYTYDGIVQLVAARLYQGQTTNFRTPGGGFAPVFVGDGTHLHPCP